jgi:hypothetical protein
LWWTRISGILVRIAPVEEAAEFDKVSDQSFLRH